MNHQEPPSARARAPNGDLGFRPIGSLLPKIERMPNGSASTQMPSQRSSETTGALAPTPKPSGSSGGALTATAAANWLAVRDAETETESRQGLTGLLARLVGSPVVWVWSDMPSDDGQFDGEITDINLPAVSSEALERAWTEVRPLCEPAKRNPEAMKAMLADIARLFAVTPAGQSAVGNDELAIQTWVEDLADYPVDCVRRALRVARRGDRWRPPLSKVLDDVRWRAAPRVACRRAFQRAGIA